MPKIKTRRKMGWFAMAVHFTLILCSAGLWTPMYLAARRRRVTITHVPQPVAFQAGPLPDGSGAMYPPMS